MFYQVAPNQKQFIVNLLTKQGITPTQQRVEIGIVLLTKTQHLSADQLLERVNEKSPVASKATVYNTLGLFVEHGLVREVIVDSKKVFYDSNTAPHHHFFNIDTGMLHDIDINMVEIKNLPDLPDSATLKDVNIVFRVEKNKDVAPAIEPVADEAMRSNESASNQLEPSLA
jgi:Fur family iron response transcriptional regulator